MACTRILGELEIKLWFMLLDWLAEEAVVYLWGGWMAC